MKLAKVIGNVVATVKYKGLEGQKILMIQPLNHDLKADGGPVAAIDAVQAGVGDLVYYTLAREATLALPEPFVPVDAAITGIVDQVNLESDQVAHRKNIFIGE